MLHWLKCKANLLELNYQLQNLSLVSKYEIGKFQRVLNEEFPDAKNVKTESISHICELGDCLVLKHCSNNWNY